MVMGKEKYIQRTLEYWNSLWRQWDNLVFEVGDEEGKYAVQDAHWEPPYFDGFTLAEDLDQIAVDMLPLIDDVYAPAKNPVLFSEALEEIAANITSYPEWMEVESDEGSTLGVNTTRCILKWLWLSSRNDSHPGQAFLDKVYEIEDNLSMISLDENESVDFFTKKLPNEVCREIYECFKSDKCRTNFDNLYTSRHKIKHLYEKQFDPAEYLETCSKHLAENWHYCLPLVNDAVNQGDYQKAESLLEETFSRFLNKGNNETWFPETSLLLDKRSYFSEGNKEEISGLLELWADVSKKRGNTKRSVAAKLQSVIFQTPEDWSAVIGEYKKTQNSELKKAIDPLFAQWQNEMARRSIPRITNALFSSETWIHWLIEAEPDITGKREWFTEKLSVWLDHLKKDTNIFVKQWPSLARLTKDVPGSEKLNKQYPTFFKIVLPDDYTMSLLYKARCSGLQKMGVDSCLSTIMDIWKNHLRSIIPDPANAHKSDYTYHTQWMKALYELSHKDYYSILNQWHLNHGRRRNLWRDMRTQGLPL